MQAPKKDCKDAGARRPAFSDIRQFRLLAIILGASILLGSYEANRSDLPQSSAEVNPDWLLDERINMAKTILELYPNRSHGYLLKAYQAGMCWEREFRPAVCWSFAYRDLRDVRAALEEALERGGDYDQEGLFHFYAFILTQLQESPESIDQAVAAWRKHYPYSKKSDPRAVSPEP